MYNCIGCAQNKVPLVEPLDYETEVVKFKTIIQNDPLRELLVFPNDDINVRICMS